MTLLFMETPIYLGSKVRVYGLNPKPSLVLLKTYVGNPSSARIKNWAVDMNFVRSQVVWGRGLGFRV